MHNFSTHIPTLLLENIFYHLRSARKAGNKRSGNSWSAVHMPTLQLVCHSPVTLWLVWCDCYHVCNAICILYSMLVVTIPEWNEEESFLCGVATVLVFTRNAERVKPWECAGISFVLIPALNHSTIDFLMCSMIVSILALIFTYLQICLPASHPRTLFLEENYIFPS